MHHSHLSRVARRLLGALPLTLLLLTMACEGPAPRTIGGYCRNDTDCVSGLRCLNLACTERRQVDGGPPEDMGGPADGGADDTGVDAGPVDTGVDLGPVDTGVDLGPVDMGVDLGPEDMGPEDMGFDAGP
jgi:hypothetical protein